MDDPDCTICSTKFSNCLRCRSYCTRCYPFFTGSGPDSDGCRFNIEAVVIIIVTIIVWLIGILAYASWRNSYLKKTGDNTTAVNPKNTQQAAGGEKVQDDEKQPLEAKYQ